MAQPVWQTPAGSLGTIAEGEFYKILIEAEDPEGGNVSYALQAGALPEGIQVKTNGTIEGIPKPYATVSGVPSEVGEDVTSTFVIRASVDQDGIIRINDRTFALTVTGQDVPEFVTPAGSLGTFYDGVAVDIDIEFTDDDPGDTVVVSVESGELPPGLSCSTNGKISGFIEPADLLPEDVSIGFDASAFDLYDFDFATRSINKNYQFTLKITDGKEFNIRTFTMFVISKDSLTSDTLEFTADEDPPTADVSPRRTPVVINYPAATTTTSAGFIGTFRHDNFFAYQIEGKDFDGDPYEFEIQSGDSADLPPGLVFNRDTGWLTGFLPDQGATELTYDFAITIYKADDNTIVSDPYNYSIKIVGDIETQITWLTGTQIGTTDVYSLGSINNGAISELYVEATGEIERTLFYRLKQGDYPDVPGVYNKLPQGLSLLISGEIAGRVSFNTFTLDSGTTTFDQERSTRLNEDPTTFDMSFTFTVEAYTYDGLISVFRTFRIDVNREYNSPYNDLYIEAYPTQDDRNLIYQFTRNVDIFPPETLYRQTDPYFGVNEQVTYTHAFSLDSATLPEYISALQLNHFKKRLVLGEIKTARALDDNGNTIYEVVYSEIIDSGVNKQGESPPQSVDTAYKVTLPDGTTITKVYPNSLINMRNQVVDTVGQTSLVLPRWMLSKQLNGRVLGFVKAWVIAYTKPNQSARIAYNIQNTLGVILNQVDFLVDRYIIDRSLTKNWVPNEDSTDGGNWLPAKQTTFDRTTPGMPDSATDSETTFDGGSCRFVSPVDYYEDTDEYNKYLVFPKTNILG